MVFSRELNVEFVSENTWLMGVPIAGGESFDNSTMYGLGLYGTSSISPSDAVDVDIHFSSNPDSSSVAYVFSASNLGQPIGIGSFPGTVWDITNPESPRRLNICFLKILIVIYFGTQQVSMVWTWNILQ